MNRRFSNESGKTDKVMKEEQFEEIVAAILNGKYSWACVLILKFAGYNPLHYIPYRTYNRLIKDNCLNKPSSQEKNQKTLNKSSDDNGDEFHRISYHQKIRDLSYLESVDKKAVKVAGGFRYFWW
ncbi:heterocyst differentiation protein [Rippkaea orientalis PCC 8801]|uniref:Heterocyst differentiation protein n=1 Tax=Rippkaea orientalis (strain PCC 8801 / RF-1) TaxID=41431 RepID=B7JYD7_RIPO1|nr:HetP family heterocyst commitment protein [Rippkaea orientalis]ACK67239.1 heterocyst differentiation protein [Rippkaea orientalis PCC 8801]